MEVKSKAITKVNYHMSSTAVVEVFKEIGSIKSNLIFPSVIPLKYMGYIL